MATFKAMVRTPRKDGFYQVYIRVVIKYKWSISISVARRCQHHNETYYNCIAKALHLANLVLSIHITTLLQLK